MTDAHRDTVATTILLEWTARLDAASIAEELRGTLKLEPADASGGSGPGDPLRLHGQLGQAVAEMVEGPVAGPALRALADTAWWWPSAGEAVDRHRAHLHIACPWLASGPLDAHVRQMVLVTSLLEHVRATAVVWGGVIVSPEQFRAMSKELFAEKRLPIPLWVRIDLVKAGEDRVLAATTGMGRFGFMEIETAPGPLAPGATFDFVRSFAQYLITSGTKVADGDKIGEDEAAPVLVRHAPSARGGGATVYRLEFAP